MRTPLRHSWVVVALAAAGCGLLSGAAGLPDAPTAEAVVGDPVGAILLRALPDGEFAVTGLAWSGVLNGEDGTIEWAVRTTSGDLFDDECPEPCYDDGQPLNLGWASSEGIYAFSDSDTMYGFDPVEEEVVWEKSITGHDLAPAPDLRHVLVIDSAGEVEAWSARTGRTEARFQIDLPAGFDIDAAKRADDANRVLLVDDDGTYLLVSLAMDSSDVLASGQIDAIDEDSLAQIRLTGAMLTIDGEPYDPATGEEADLPDGSRVEESLDDGVLWSVTGEMAVFKIFREAPGAGDVRIIDLATGESNGLVASNGSNLITTFPAGDDLTSLLGITEDQRLVAMTRTEAGFITAWEADLPASVDGSTVGSIVVGDGRIAMLADGSSRGSLPVIFPTGS